ncbi:DUF6232 family protein [Actinoplanes sp. NPDC049316]|uniref:DUF6232 family protein n=1 Tax=Actinoplanes sp. NPDC049316 TaxID=3154727 RepID=UPI003428CA94
MRIYYHDPGVCVSSAAFSVPGFRYPLDDIERVWRVRRRALGRRSLAAAALLTGAGLAQVGICLAGRWILGGRGLALVVAALVVVRAMARLITGAVAVNAVEDLRRYGRRLELWAGIQGTPVLLVSTDDAIRHGRICRALARALGDRADMR